MDMFAKEILAGYPDRCKCFVNVKQKEKHYYTITF